MKSLYINKIDFNKMMLAVAVLGLAACKPSIDTITPDKGTADFSRYIAVGDSYTAGFADGGLYLEGQRNSIPEMLAAQMRNVGGGGICQSVFY